MLDDIYKSYLDYANVIPEWQKENKNDLIRKYCELRDKQDPYAEYYLAAIICKYWPKLWRFKQKTPIGCTDEDVYDWLIQAILGTLAFDPLPWENPNNSLYNDPNGPDKCINIQMSGRRASHLVYINRKKRSANVLSVSLEQLNENNGDAIDFDEDSFVAASYTLSDLEIEYKSILQSLMLQQKYYLFFVYFTVITDGCSGSNGKFSTTKLVKELSSITADDLKYISENSEIPYKDVLYAYSCSILGKSNDHLHGVVKKCLYELKKLYYNGEI